MKDIPETGHFYHYYKEQKIVEIVGIGKRLDTKEDMVCCVSTADHNTLWLIPLDLWCGTVDCEGKTVPCFTKVKEQGYPVGTSYPSAPTYLRSLVKRLVDTTEE
jgi:hypothetical protein